MKEAEHVNKSDEDEIKVKGSLGEEKNIILQITQQCNGRQCGN